MVHAIIQARMGSSRLPGKVLRKVAGKPLLLYQVERVARAKMIDRIVVATSTDGQDDSIAAFCEHNRINCFRGSEHDVLSRYYECARRYPAETLVRLTADCPLSDPAVVDAVVQCFYEKKVDYAANTVPVDSSTYPDGSDVEVFSATALERAHREARDPQHREHVTFYFWQQDNGFATAQLRRDPDWSQYRFTVDYPEDFEVVAFVLQELQRRGSFGHLAEIVAIIDGNPAIRVKNAQYYSGIGWEQT